MDLLDKATDAAKRVAGTAKDGLSKAKEKGQEFTLTRRLSSQAEELGHVVHRQRSGESGLDAEVERLDAEMLATEAEIKALAEA